MTDKEARDYIQLIFDGYKKRKSENHLYGDIDTTKAIIESYINYVEKPKFAIILNQYKRNYIFSESHIEDNYTQYEQDGLSEMYDYIDSFDFKKDKFNIFVTSLVLHGKLYSKCPNPSYGGKLRQSTAYLVDTNIEVESPEEARKYFNSLIPRSDEIFAPLSNNDIFGYINNCIIQTTKLIKVQPFEDGNKRTFRAILNLLLKKINIPPIYIESYEINAYKHALLEAMKYESYDALINFYYSKICDSIMNLDINKSKITDKNDIDSKKY